MKITLYTITNCQFSKQEKDYLASHQLTFEEKNLETNKEFLTEMLAVSNNFAGTPVTKIEKDDGQIAVLKGFTPTEFDTVLGFSAPAPAPAVAASTVTPPPVTNPTPAPVAPPQPPVVETPPTPLTPEPTPTITPEPPVVTVPPEPAPAAPPQPPVVETINPAQASQLNSIMNNLQEKSGTPSAAPTNNPTIPDFH